MDALVTEAGALSAAPWLPLAAPLQSRICWLVRCWWAFGGGEGGEEDERSCAASYAMLCQMLHGGADLAVRLQASVAIGGVLGSLDGDNLRLFAPAAPSICAGLASSLAASETDAGRLWLLRLLGRLARKLPGLTQQPETVQALPPILGALWHRAQQERQDLLVRELRRVAHAGWSWTEAVS